LFEAEARATTIRMQHRSQLAENEISGADDLALVKRIGSQGPQGFEPIMRRYNQRLYRLAYGLMGEASEAEDVLQESYVRAYRRLSSFAGKASLGTWLARIVRNEAIDRLRARRLRQGVVILDVNLRDDDDSKPSVLEQACSQSPQCDPELDVARDELRDALETAITSLPAHFRSVFILRAVEGLSINETAQSLGIPAATVKTRDHRARLLLREKLGDQVDALKDRAFAFLGSRCNRLVLRVLAQLER
jgi:RNA polymerase sigma-70 factor (ECF subfamily)